LFVHKRFVERRTPQVRYNLLELRIAMVVLAVDLRTTLGMVTIRVSQIRRGPDLGGHRLFPIKCLDARTDALLNDCSVPLQGLVECGLERFESALLIKLGTFVGKNWSYVLKETASGLIVAVSICNFGTL